jgi:dihydropteroate synthase
LSGKLYLRPTGFIWTGPGAPPDGRGDALPVAGGPLSCLGFEVIEGRPGHATRRFVSARDMSASTDPDIRRLLANLTAARHDIAGVSLARTRIMGIVNVTPDSFSDGGDFREAEAAATHAKRLAGEGAAFIDIGGESTRPGAAAVGEGEELRRIGPVLQRLRDLPAAISVDTRKAAVMRAALAGGARLLNDVSALAYDAQSLATVVALGCPVVLMHAKGDPRTMQDNPVYEDVLLEVYDFLQARIEAAEAAGILRHLLVADPGIGFGKTMGHNLALLAGIGLFHTLGVPVLLGVSRKRFIGTITGETDPKQRGHGSLGAAIAAASHAVQILRVHDVAGTRQALDAWRASFSGIWSPETECPAPVV